MKDNKKQIKSCTKMAFEIVELDNQKKSKSVKLLRKIQKKVHEKVKKYHDKKVKTSYN